MPLRSHRLLTRGAIVTTAAAVAMVITASAAAAHVTVSPGSITAGSFTTLTFRMPNESATADVTKLVLTLPADHPFPTVSARHIPGWTVSLTTTQLPAPITEGDFTLTEAITAVTFTADDTGELKPKEYLTFDVYVGPVPDVRTMLIPATQTYDDNTTVEWNEPTPASGPAPDHPAPTLTIQPAGQGNTQNPSNGMGDMGAMGATGTTPQTQAADTTPPVSYAITLAAIAAAFSVYAALLAVLTWRRTKRYAELPDPNTHAAMQD